MAVLIEHLGTLTNTLFEMETNTGNPITYSSQLKNLKRGVHKELDSLLLIFWKVKNSQKLSRRLEVHKWLILWSCRQWLNGRSLKWSSHSIIWVSQKTLLKRFSFLLRRRLWLILLLIKMFIELCKHRKRVLNIKIWATKNGWYVKIRLNSFEQNLLKKLKLSYFQIW